MTTWLENRTDNCSVQRTLDVIGEKWTLLLLRDAANGVHRFDDFRRHVGLSEAVLTDRLRTLVGAGILETREYQEPGQRRRREYRMTAKGWDLLPALVAVMQWGDKYLADDAGPPWVIRHKACGRRVRAEVRCTYDHELLTEHDTKAGPGPGARPVESSRG